MILNDETVFAVIDVETTGLDHSIDKVIEVACVTCTVNGISTSMANLYDPGVPIPASASAIHHITDEHVRGCGIFRREGEGEPVSMWPGIGTWTAHNAAFDGPFLGLTGPVLCTMRLAQKLWPELESHSNQVLRYHFKLKPPLESNAPMHRALPDAIVTATLLIHELKTIQQRGCTGYSTVEELIEWINEPMLLHTVRFGKHKGSTWDLVPRDYLRWLVNNANDMDNDTLYTARHYLDG